jgi:hypothetical protein
MCHAAAAFKMARSRGSLERFSQRCAPSLRKKKQKRSLHDIDVMSDVNYAPSVLTKGVTTDRHKAG